MHRDAPVPLCGASLGPADVLSTLGAAQGDLCVACLVGWANGLWHGARSAVDRLADLARCR